MNQFSISDIENMTNIKAHTLRVWEQRYGLFAPKRKDSQHRYYDGEDLKHLLRIAWLYHQGKKISYIACLTEEEIKQMALSLTGTPIDMEIYLNQLLEASLDLDAIRFNDILDAVIKEKGIETAMHSLIFPFLKKLGVFWLTGHIIPSQEHFASALIIQKLMVAIDRLPKDTGNTDKRHIALFTPAGEFHEIPILFLHYLLRKKGVSHHYLGTNVSVEIVKAMGMAKPFTHLYFHQITLLNKSNLEEYIKELHQHFPEVALYCSGACLQSINIYDNHIHYLKDENAIREFIG